MGETPREGSNLSLIRKIIRRVFFTRTVQVTPAPGVAEINKQVQERERCFRYILYELRGIQAEDDLPVANLGRTMYLHIHSSRTLAWKTLFLKVLTLLTCHHPQATVLLLLEHSLPLDGRALEVWRALGANAHLASHVLGTLTSRILERPTVGVSDRAAWDRHSLESIAATNVVYELLFAREYSGAVFQFFPRLFLALITQVHYVLELGLRADREQEVGDPTVPSVLGPWRTSLEALKGLLSSQDCWKTFTSLELQDGWDLFACLETFQEGVVLLARTMVQNRCPVVGDLLTAVATSLPGMGRQGRSIAVGLLGELIWIPKLGSVLETAALQSILQDGLEDPDPMVRVTSLQALNSQPLNPKKGPLLRARSLGQKGLETFRPDMAFTLGPYIDDERAPVRTTALEMLTAVAHGGVREKQTDLRQELIRRILPILVHMRDEDAAVRKKARATFFCLADNLGWKTIKSVSQKLMGEQGLHGASYPIWSYMYTPPTTVGERRGSWRTSSTSSPRPFNV